LSYNEVNVRLTYDKITYVYCTYNVIGKITYLPYVYGCSLISCTIHLPCRLTERSEETATTCHLFLASPEPTLARAATSAASW